jgi:hypothetical protein
MEYGSDKIVVVSWLDGSLCLLILLDCLWHSMCDLSSVDGVRWWNCMRQLGCLLELECNVLSKSMRLVELSQGRRNWKGDVVRHAC